MSVLAESESEHVRQPLPSQEEIKKLPPDGGDEFNRLIFSQSPYLLQHARNPIDWYPWGEEAFEKAKKENKPVFLSIGYTTCHWCHVMERESFEDEEVAELMNKYFVPIKVDREERPDIDEVYMTVTQAMTGGGGWPMTVLMTPDKKPFFAGTYFPKTDKPGRPGLMQVLRVFGEGWNTRRDELLEQSEKVTTFLKESYESKDGELPNAETLEKAFAGLKEQYDPEHGGFGRAPKFPVPPNLSFLLRYHKRTGNEEALEMVKKTLEEMRLGGVYDHVGFGTHRYSTDREWLLPHFEKMLYDQALLAIANIEAYQATGDEFFARTAKEIFTYVLRDMTSPEGGFYSAEDADSEGEEGKFYVWTPEEVIEVLGEEDGKLFNRVFQIEEGGNFVEEATREKTGESIPHLVAPIEEPEMRGRLEEMRQKLFEAREKRIHPQKDDKILTDWNGLMITAFAKGAQVFDSAEYRDAATKAADFVLETLRNDEGRLLKRYRRGEAGLTAHLEDYAFMIWGLIDLYEATFESRYLKEAIALTDEMIEHFWDEEDGGLFMTADDSEELLVRSKKLYGGAIPSGNAVAALNLVRLHRMTGEGDYDERAATIMTTFGAEIERYPAGFPQLMIAVDFMVGPSKEIVIAGEPGSEGVRKMVAALREPFLPRKVVLFRPAGEDAEIADLAPYTKNQVPEDGQATAYVCENFACNLPTTSVEKMMELLAGDKP